MASIVAVDPETVQMEGVAEVKPTGSPELAVAVNVTGYGETKASPVDAQKVIVWTNGLTAKLCVTARAAA
jgi:hypothetical protein